ncbi:hypothetical protein [Vreelandella sp. TE19]
MEKYENVISQHLNQYSNRCISILVRFIEAYEKELSECELTLECICEVYDKFSLSLTFLNFPDMANYGQILEDNDKDFMRKPQFMKTSYRDWLQKEIREYIIENDVDEDESEAYDEIMSLVVPKWLRECWLQANKQKGTAYNLFYFVHRYFNEKPINLLNNEGVWLENIAEQC